MLNTGDRAPEIALAGPGGGRLELSKALEKGPALAAFFKVNCPTCQLTLPYIDRLYRAYGSGEIAFCAVSQDDGEKTRDFCQRYGITFPAALDWPEYKASRSYAFEYVPAVYLIGSDGKIRFSLSGFAKAGLNQLSQEIAGLLGREVTAVFRPGEQVPEQKPG